MSLDRESWTARRVGPLDLDMLADQRELLTALREQTNAQDEPHTADAIDGMIHLCSHLQDQYEYAVQEQGFPRRQRMLIHANRAADELRAIAELADEGDDDFREVEETLDRFDELHSSLQEAWEQR